MKGDFPTSGSSEAAQSAIDSFEKDIQGLETKEEINEYCQNAAMMALKMLKAVKGEEFTLGFVTGALSDPDKLAVFESKERN